MGLSQKLGRFLVRFTQYGSVLYCVLEFGGSVVYVSDVSCLTVFLWNMIYAS